MIHNYARCNVAIAPLRKDPEHASEQISQLLFGEKVEVTEIQKNGWVKIKNQWDEYEGWCKQSQLLIIHKREFHKASKYYVSDHNGKFIYHEAHAMWVPVGAELDKSTFKLEGISIKYKGRKTISKNFMPNSDTLLKTATSFLFAPYLWGGRTIAGIDCSGFTQMVYKLAANFRIHRDASMQATQGELVDFLQNAICGDLAFFDNDLGNITHVGMLLDASTIIHATDSSGKVVVDRIDNGGIISTEHKIRTHNLRMVKRYF